MSRFFTIFLFFFFTIAECVQAQDISLDLKLGTETAKQVEQEMGLYHHDSLELLINRVGEKLVSRLKNNPFDYKFFIVDSEIPNAFAIPGGNIYLSRGIFAIIQTEDELAGIIAHEIIHIAQRHSIKQMKKSKLTGILKVPGNLLNAVTGTQIGNVLNVPVGFTTSAYSAKHSRGHETEADKFGLQLAASAGYKTDALADALERLSLQVALLTGEAEKHSYFSDHPFTPSRVVSIRKIAGMYPPVKPSAIASSQKEFLYKMNGLCFGPNPEQGVFNDSLFIHPHMACAWIIPSGWQTINKPVMVAAYNEKGNAIVAMRVSDQTGTAHAIGEAAKKKSKDAEGITVEFAGDTTIHSFPAYMLRLRSVENKQEVVSEIIWLNYRNTMLELISAGVPAARNVMHQSLCSFRTASPEELQNLVIYEMKIVQAKENETVEQLSARTGNKLLPSMTDVMNNHTDKKPFMKGEPVKIVTVAPYQSESKP